MSSAVIPWPCPVCAEMVPLGDPHCPQCHASADWIDLLRALDFSLRRFSLWELEGFLSMDEYRALLEATRQWRAELVEAARAGQPVPDNLGLPSRSRCWSCKTPCDPVAPKCPACGVPLQTQEARLLRYQAFLCHEIGRQHNAGRLTSEQWEAFLTQTPARQIELLSRLKKA